jgi:hypothetical protein
MSATAAQVAILRRMVNEPTETTYDDDTLEAYIETYPVMDERGEVPYTWDTSTQPPTKEDNDDWFPTYDLHAAAADIWQEKAATVATDFSFSADGGQYNRDQVYQQYMKQAKYHRSRRHPTTIEARMYPEPTTNANDLALVVNRRKREL